MTDPCCFSLCFLSAFSASPSDTSPPISSSSSSSPSAAASPSAPVVVRPSTDVPLSLPAAAPLPALPPTLPVADGAVGAMDFRFRPRFAPVPPPPPVTEELTLGERACEMREAARVEPSSGGKEVCRRGWWACEMEETEVVVECFRRFCDEAGFVVEAGRLLGRAE